MIWNELILQYTHREREREHIIIVAILKIVRPHFILFIIASNFTSDIGWPRDGGDDVTL